ncbi:MAG: leucine-rich repeat domain-containing protein [[Clostridium] fimetarium]|nr:leucine-rich repeat domain-containing protein [Alistipes timonensis]MCM1406185.1 leucine-rich repeat domain-containing protein [[Clostridium] fimetarium]
MRYLLPLAIAAAASLQAAALDVTSEAGQLRGAVGTSTDAAELRVSGSVDAADLMFIHSEMTSLKSLDLSGATLAAYEGEALLNSVSSSPAGVIPPAAFLGMKIAEFSFPKNTTAIGEGAFAATSLASVAVPEGVTSIGNSAFADSPELSAVSLPASAVKLGTGLFRGCGKLASVSFKGNIAEIPPLAFSGCRSLESFAIPSSVRVIGEKAFAGSGLKVVAVNDIDSIAPWAFTGCASLGEVTFSGSMPRAIGEGAFFRDAAAEVAAGELLKSLETIPAHAFTGVKSVSGLADGTAAAFSEVGDYALAYTSVGPSVAFPSTMREVGKSAFANWTGTRYIDAADLTELPEIGDDIFGTLDKGNTTLYVSRDMLDAFRDAPQWKDFNIEARTSGETGVALPDTPSGAEVRGWFEGAVLRVSATSEISAVELFDIGGLRLAFLPASGTLDFSVDTAPFASRAYIVRVNLGPDTVKLLKVAR